MLRKLLKYELQATARVLLPMYGVLLAISLINRIFWFKGNLIVTENTILTVTGVITLMLYYGMMMITGVMTVLVLIQRFYKNLLGAEGYLMHTLPVPTWALLLSKTISGLIWAIISGIVWVLSIFVLAFNIRDWGEFFRDFALVLESMWEMAGAEGILILVEMILIGLLLCGLGILQMYVAMCVGQLFQKHRILASIGAYLILVWVFNMILGVLFATMVSNQNLMEWLRHWVANTNGSEHVIVWGIILGGIVVDGLHFFTSNYILKNRLNLE